MRTHRVGRILTPTAALVALALALVLLGLALTGPANASTSRLAVESKDTIVQFGNDVIVTRNESVGTIVAFGGDVTVAGEVRQTIVAFGGDVSLKSTAVVGSDMSRGDTAIVAFGGKVTKSPDAAVTGTIERADGWDWKGVRGISNAGDFGRWFGFSFFGWLVQTAICLVLALVAAALMPRQMLAVQRHLAVKPAASLGWGALTFFVAVPAAIVILVISIVGILLVIPGLVAVLLAYFFVTTAVAAFIAQKVLSGGVHRQNLMLAVTLGVIGTTIVFRIPVAGPLAQIVMTVFGTGAAVLAILEWRRGRRTSPAPAPVGPGPLTGTAQAAPDMIAPAAYMPADAPQPAATPDEARTAVLADQTAATAVMEPPQEAGAASPEPGGQAQAAPDASRLSRPTSLDLPAPIEAPEAPAAPADAPEDPAADDAPQPPPPVG